MLLASAQHWIRGKSGTGAVFHGYRKSLPSPICCLPRFRSRHIEPAPQARPARAITQVEGSGTAVMITEKISGDAVLSSRELVLGTLETIPPKM